MKNYYEVLGLTKTATAEEIKKSYKKLVRAAHPDANPGDATAAERFKEIQEAYDILSDPAKKAHYDGGGLNMQFRTRSPFNSMGAGFSFQDVMEGFFGGSNFRGSNITVRVEIDFEESFNGCKRKIKIKKKKVCSTCRGKGFASFDHCNVCGGSGNTQVNDGPFQIRMPCGNCSGTGRINVKKCESCNGMCYSTSEYDESEMDVDIPAGVDNGMQMKMNGRGEDSLKGGTPGDLVIQLIVKGHKLFTRDELNLCVEIPVSYTQLVLGGDIEVPTLTGEKGTIKVPAGCQSNTKFRLKGKGFLTGDLIATLKLDVPNVLSEDYKTVIDSLSELERNNVSPKIQDYLSKLDVK